MKWLNERCQLLSTWHEGPETVRAGGRLDLSSTPLAQGPEVNVSRTDFRFTPQSGHDRAGRSGQRGAICGSRLSRQFVEQCLGLLQIGHIKTLREPAVDGGEQFAGLLGLALIAPQAGHAHRRAQFK